MLDPVDRYVFLSDPAWSLREIYVALGGLVVTMVAIIPEACGLKPGRERRIFN
jgi:hypothetical protein